MEGTGLMMNTKNFADTMRENLLLALVLAVALLVFGSWMLTGESRPYHAGNVGNVEPTGRWGAFELLLRYSVLDLDDAPVQGGREHDWTLGANWYLTTHFKVQLNVVRAWSDRGGSSLDPRIFEARVQLMF